MGPCTYTPGKQSAAPDAETPASTVYRSRHRPLPASMFQTFTGSSRRPRQVNLSGRTANPFAKAGVNAGTQSAVLSAQQERERRQQERDRLAAAKTLQRAWRGHRCRRQVRERWREQWDSDEETAVQEISAYESEDVALRQLKRLLHFVDARNEKDAGRILHCWRRIRCMPGVDEPTPLQGNWQSAFLQSQNTLLHMIDVFIAQKKDAALRLELLKVLHFITKKIADLTARNADHLYRTMAAYVHAMHAAKEQRLEDQQEGDLVIGTVASPLQPMSKESLHSYAAFGCEFLSMHELNLSELRPLLDAVAAQTDSRRLASALSTVVSARNYAGYSEMLDSKSRTTLLGCFIYIHNRALNGGAHASHKDFVHVISALLSSVADEISLDELPEPDSEQREGELLSPFVREQVMSLVNQESIGSVLSGVRGTKGAGGSLGLGEDAKQFASYALTLLRFFPRRGDEIRMWLYLGSTASSASGDRIPAIKYFWQAARSSSIFNTISNDSRAAVNLLRPQTSSSSSSVNQPRWLPPQSESTTHESIQDEWRVVFVFFELYTFVLKLMDDQEFFSGSALPGAAKKGSTNWASYNALPLNEVKHLTTFLKNLGFTMYFNAKDIEDAGERDGSIGSLSSYFSVPGMIDEARPAQETTKQAEVTVAGLAGMSIDYVKGLVTGLLRMIYERDSRRTFLPKDHWLMTSRFDMGTFIPAVVQEEEDRHKVQEEDDADIDQDDGDFEDVPHLIGTGGAQRLRQNERLQRQQRRASRKRYLQAVAPRLEILQNMPFFIPFETRVQIFRQFVHLDQVSRAPSVRDQRI